MNKFLMDALWRDMHPSRDSHTFAERRKKITIFFFQSHADLMLISRFSQRRQLKIVSHRRAVTKRTENDGLTVYVRVIIHSRCVRHICLSAQMPQPRDARRIAWLKQKKIKEWKRKEREREKRKYDMEKGSLGDWNDLEALDFVSEVKLYKARRAFIVKQT